MKPAPTHPGPMIVAPLPRKTPQLAIAGRVLVTNRGHALTDFTMMNDRRTVRQGLKVKGSHEILIPIAIVVMVVVSADG